MDKQYYKKTKLVGIGNISIIKVYLFIVQTFSAATSKEKSRYRQQEDRRRRRELVARASRRVDAYYKADHALNPISGK